MILKKIFPYSFLLVIFALFLYSFTQVSLSLTLTRASFFQQIQRGFQEIGYFQRDISTLIFLVLIFLMTFFYIFFMNLALKKKLNLKVFTNIVIFTGVILSFSYVAFSNDLFNYIFDAKIITFYGENPYFKKALDFPGDPMLSFMHWTHRYYPYGPIWLAVTVPLSFMGLQVFLLTYFLFKFLATVFYFGSVFLIYKINKRINPGFELLNTVFFALNPLVIIESLVSSHNDIAMVFFALLGIYMYMIRNKVLGIISVVISAAIKLPTAVLLLPMVINLLPINKKYKFEGERLTWVFVILSILGLFYAMTRLEIQPWYFLWVLPFLALVKPNKYVISIATGISVGLLLRYTQFLYFGNWDDPFIRNALNSLAIVFVSIAVGFVWSRKKSYNYKHLKLRRFREKS
jgi:hypothetical protein